MDNHNKEIPPQQYESTYGVGSQRRELRDETVASEWMKLRRDFPEVSLLVTYA
ncbi:MAG: hypothetical protein H0U75_03635 [Legionella sp.]|nr:hypothetical protein [Legionella sp.]